MDKMKTIKELEELKKQSHRIYVRYWCIQDRIDALKDVKKLINEFKTNDHDNMKNCKGVGFNPDCNKSFEDLLEEIIARIDG